ncbi:MAG: ABC transporter permease subunit [Candidatus Heimdallarchaeota archaeon]|nr:ABC transporter permease subunit [Candidatus Heimdallarchaeota archaeon]
MTTINGECLKVFEKRTKGQFLPILKKDLRLVFTVKTILIIVVVPFIMMFLIIGLPTIFIGTMKTTIYICNQDQGSIEQHVNGTFYQINLGQAAVINIQNTFENSSNVKIKLVDTRGEALNSSQGIWIPANFTEATFDGQSVFEYYQTAAPTSPQAAYLNQAITKVQETVASGFLFLNLENELPEIVPVEYRPPAGEPTPGGWKESTLNLASPFAYAIFILVSLVGAMGRTIGFAKEKEDGTFETLLTITKNRTLLVLSKFIVGIIASFLSILAYFLGSVFAGLMSGAIIGDTNVQSGIEGILAIPKGELLSGNGELLLFGLAFCLALNMLALMTVDTLFSRTVSERLGTSLVIGLGMLFYFSVVFDPTTTAFFAVINPFYWIYHSFLSIIDLSFRWMDALYLVLSIALFVGLLILATKAIEREKVLFT